MPDTVELLEVLDTFVEAANALLSTPAKFSTALQTAGVDPNQRIEIGLVTADIVAALAGLTKRVAWLAGTDTEFDSEAGAIYVVR